MMKLQFESNGFETGSQILLELDASNRARCYLTIWLLE
tara:strand:- start:813 stop:926 length:114 start_codon:yes stop_codon:yes gene_type:complete